MSVFADSSALVKRYADEPGATTVRALESLVVCAIARVEIPAALWRKHRLGELEAVDAGLLVEQFEWEWLGGDATPPLFAAVALTDRVLADAARACARHGLRACDAVQLAAALAARDADPTLEGFVCFDDELASAARLEGFRILGAA